MEQRTDLREIIEYLNPAELEYQEWVDVGMALKHEGYPMEIWDSWSRNDSRYHLALFSPAQASLAPVLF